MAPANGGLAGDAPTKSPKDSDLAPGPLAPRQAATGWTVSSATHPGDGPFWAVPRKRHDVSRPPNSQRPVAHRHHRPVGSPD